jgi:hypothetical protein
LSESYASKRNGIPTAPHPAHSLRPLKLTDTLAHSPVDIVPLSSPAMEANPVWLTYFGPHYKSFERGK